MTSGLQGWHPDPFGRHEERYFSAGEPTYLIRDGDAEGRDPVDTAELGKVNNDYHHFGALQMDSHAVQSEAVPPPVFQPVPNGPPPPTLPITDPWAVLAPGPVTPDGPPAWGYPPAPAWNAGASVPAASPRYAR